VRLSLMAMERAQARADDAGLPLRRWLEATLERALLPSEKADVADAKGRHPTTKRADSATEADALAARITRDPPRLRAVVPVAGDSLTGVVAPSADHPCGHVRYEVLASTGMRRCKDCGALRGLGDVWRVP